MLEAHILKSFPGENDPRTQGDPHLQQSWAWLSHSKNLPFLLVRVGVSEILIH